MGYALEMCAIFLVEEVLEASAVGWGSLVIDLIEAVCRKCDEDSNKPSWCYTGWLSLTCHGNDTLAISLQPWVH